MALIILWRCLHVGISLTLITGAVGLPVVNDRVVDHQSLIENAVDGGLVSYRSSGPGRLVLRMKMLY